MARYPEVPASKFACPSLRAYPINTLERVVNARVRTKTFGEKCAGQTQKICAEARKRGLLSPSYKGYRGWQQFCGR